MRRIPKLSAARTAVGASVLALALTGCAGQGMAGEGGGGEGVPSGSSREVYRAAFAEVDPIELTIQSSGTPGSTASAMFEQYQEVVEDWSDGKITFEHVYSDGVAPLLEADNAMADGRLGMAAIAAANEPQEFPVSATLNSMSFLGSQDYLLNAMATHAWGNELALGSEALYVEYDEMGVRPITPFYTGGSVALFCTDPVTDLASLKGRQVGTSTVTQQAQVRALDMVSVSLPFTEAFESLQRGIIDCTIQSYRVAGLINLLDVAPHVVNDPEVGWGLSMGAFSVSKMAFDSLPLVAQQLLYDKGVDFVVNDVVGVLNSVAALTEDMQGRGITVQGLGEDGVRRLSAANDAILTGLVNDGAAGPETGDLVESAGQLVPEWEQIVSDLGYEIGGDRNGFAEYWASADIDWEPYAEQVRVRVYDPARPGGDDS